MDAPHNGLPLTRPLWQQDTPLAGAALPRLPRLTTYLPSEELRSGQAMVICPGGGYGMLSVPKEGHGIGLAKNHPWGAAMLNWLKNRIA